MGPLPFFPSETSSRKMPWASGDDGATTFFLSVHDLRPSGSRFVLSIRRKWSGGKSPPPGFVTFSLLFFCLLDFEFYFIDFFFKNTERGVIQDLMVEGIKGVEGTGINPIP